MGELIFEPTEGEDGSIDVRFAEDGGRRGAIPGRILGIDPYVRYFAPSGRDLYLDELDQIAAKLRELNAAEGGSDEQ